MSHTPEPRITLVLDLLRALAAGRMQPATSGVELARAIDALEVLDEELTALQAKNDRTEERVGEILEVVYAVARKDFTRQARCSDDNDIFDSLAMGLNMMVEDLVSSSAFVASILASMDYAVLTVSLEGVIVSANPAAHQMLRHEEGKLQSRPLSSIQSDWPEASLSAAQLHASGPRAAEEARCVDSRGQTVPIFLAASAMRDSRGELKGVVYVLRDITERKRVLAERERLEEAVQRQAESIVAMSTPLIPISDDIVVMPLVGVVDQERAGQVIDTLLRGVQAHHARVAILDITGVPVVDSEVAAALTRAVNAARLVGVEVMLTGIRPEVAMTLVSLGVDLSGIATLRDLKSAVASARDTGKRPQARR